MTLATTLGRIERHGIVIPRIAYGEAERAGLELAVACAFLMQESGGGRNVFGHDPTIYAGAGTVTKTKYLAYKTLRKQTGKMQGVGPMQLTWFSYQDAADRMGGCWNPTLNVREGFELVAGYIKGAGLWKGAYDYNGSGPAAVNYANSVAHLVAVWRLVLAGRALTPARFEKIAAELEDEAQRDTDNAGLVKAVLSETYLPKGYCWAGRSIQVRVDCRPAMMSFLHAHPYLRAFSGLRPDATGDHRCGAALDMVPLTTDARGKAATFKAHDDAVRSGLYPYVEPMAATWMPGNHHLHVSFKRC